MKNLEQKLAEFEAKLENLSNTKLAVDNKSVSVSIPVKPKDKIYIPPYKRNHKEKVYFARLDKCKNSDVDVEVSKPMFKPSIRVYKKYVLVPTCHLCGVVGHIRPNCSLLRQKPKSETRFAVSNTDVPKFVHVCHFCGVSGHIRSNCHFAFQSRICDDISRALSPNKLFHMLLKNLNLLACERKLQDVDTLFCNLHLTSHGG